MATSVVNPRAQFFANNGRPLIGGRIHTYVAGSSTRARTYKDAAKTQPNTNPIILDGRGEAQIYLAEGVEYKFVVEDSKGSLIYTQEPVYGAIWPNAEQWPSDATLSYQYMLDAKAAAGAIGPIKFYDTYAQAMGDIANIPNDGLVEISRDETKDGARTRYFKRAGDILEFAVNLDQLRLDLKREDGAARVGFKQPGAGATSSTVMAELKKHVSPDQYGAAGDGIADDSAHFLYLENEFSGQEVDLLGKTYAVDAIPFGNKYRNGFFKVGSNLTQANYQPPMNGRNRYVLGDNALASLPEGYDVGASGSVIAIGVNTMRDTVAVKKSIAIGPGAMRESIINRDNIAIGEDALQRVQSRSADYSQAEQQGTRNIAIGANSQNFTFEGHRNVSVGRNSGQTIVNGTDNTAIGMNAMCGEVMFGLSGAIENNSPYNGSGATAVGNFALAQYIGQGPMVAIGQNAAYSARLGTHGVALGYNAARGADSNIDGFGNTILWEGGETGAYDHNGTTLTMTFPNAHGASVGARVRFRLLDGGSQTALTDSATAIVTSVSGGTITVAHPINMVASGAALLQRVSSQTPATSNARDYVAIGSNACANSTDLRDSVTIGMVAGSAANSLYRSVAIGSNAARFCATLSQSVVMGRNAAAGSSANPITLLENSVVLGEGAGVAMQNGSPITTLSNVVLLGQGSAVSGNNQVQLGKSSSTTYAYGAVQDRSDERDKADVRDTVLGLDFIKDIRPVDFKWDMRDDYVVTHEDGTVEVLPKDGSKKRNRYHHGVIAQELRAVMEKHGVDFGGFQDHSVNGGCDVLTVGYTELIGPLIKAVQQLSARVEALELKTGPAPGF